MIDGQLELDDPAARGVLRAELLNRCQETLRVSIDRARHFVRRRYERGDSPTDVVIIICNMDDSMGAMLGDGLMPGHDWQSIRDQGLVPMARGLARRQGVQEFVDEADFESGDVLRATAGLAIVVVDVGVVLVIAARDLT